MVCRVTSPNIWGNTQHQTLRGAALSENLEDTTTEASPAPDTPPGGDQVSETPDATPSSSNGESEQLSFLDALTKATKTEPSSSSDEPQGQTPDEAAAEGASAEGTDPKQGAKSEDDPEGTPGDDDAEGDLPDSDELTDAERKSMSKRAARRIEQLLNDRREAREQAEKAKPILDYMRQNDIPMQDVDVVLGMAAQLRHGDFAGFLRTINPYVNLARQYVGEVLPPDLKEQVDKGFVSQKVARELAARRAQSQVQAQQAQRAQRSAQEEVRHLRGEAIRSAVTNWEQQTQKTDPDYGAKADLVRRTAQALIAENGPPQTPEQAVEVVKQAYKEANEAVSRFRPKPKATQPQPESVHQTSKSPAPEPQSMLDVVRMAAGGS